MNQQVILVVRLVMMMSGFLKGYVQMDNRSKNQTTPDSTTQAKVSIGWGLIEVSPNAFMSIIYKDTFRVSVYKQENAGIVDPTRAQFYYSPALILDPSSAVCAFNAFNKRHEVSFAVIMYDKEYEDFIHSAVNQELGSVIPRSRLRTLPIESIRIDTTDHTHDYEVLNQWTSYASQPAVFDFRLRVLKNSTCLEVAQKIKDFPKQFTSDLIVYYSLQTQRSAKRRIQIKAEHVQSGNLFTRLDQKFSGKDIVYLQADDLKKLTLEIAASSIATEVTDDEFISQDQTLTISNLLEGLLKVRQRSTEDFDKQMWNSVFWDSDNARPDKVAETLNDFYNKTDEKGREIVKASLTNEGTASVNSEASLLGLVSAKLSASFGFKHLTNDESDKLHELLTENKGSVQWKGEKFVPKTFQLSRTNLAALRAVTVITTVQVSVTKTVSELSTRINLLDPAKFVSGMQEQRSELNQLRKDLELSLVPRGTIRMSHSAAIPVGWLRCDGSPIDCQIYSELCSLLGSTTPDFRGRFAVGVGGGDYGANVGSIGGEAKHTLTVAEMPSHNHGVQLRYTDLRTPQPFLGFASDMGSSYIKLQYQSEYTGSSQPHNNLPPFRAVHFLVKT